MDDEKQINSNNPEEQTVDQSANVPSSNLVENTEAETEPVKSEEQKKQDEKDRETNNNAQVIDAAADVAIATKNPYAAAVGGAIKTASKVTGGKSNQALGRITSVANKYSPGGKNIQKGFNNLAESGAANAVGTAASFKNGGGSAASKGAESAGKAADAASKADKAANAANAADSAKKGSKAAQAGKTAATTATSSALSSENKSDIIPLLIILGVPGAFLFLIIFFLIIFLVTSKVEIPNIDTSSGHSIVNGFSPMSVHRTPLSREEFIEKVKSYNVSSHVNEYQVFKDNAGLIYDMGIQAQINPEIAVIRAVVEGFDPGTSKNNYWGLGCSNGGNSAIKCSSYSSFTAGLSEFYSTINRLAGDSDSIYEVFNNGYAYIGDYWYATYCHSGNKSRPCSDKGGCYYYESIKDYLSFARSLEVSGICATSTCMDNGSGNCISTTAEDQEAYVKWQVYNKMIPLRKEIFDIESDSIDLYNKGLEIVAYAIDTFDDYLYDMGSLRHSSTHVDCSSLVAQTYEHFNKIVYDGYDNTGGILKWCVENEKLVSEEDLIPGDIIVWANSSYSGTYYKGAHHVALYVGNRDGVDYQFAAHTSHAPAADQVSESVYYRGPSGNDTKYFCRPFKGE